MTERLADRLARDAAPHVLECRCDIRINRTDELCRANYELVRDAITAALEEAARVAREHGGPLQISEVGYRIAAEIEKL